MDVLVGRQIHVIMWDHKITQSEMGRRIGMDQSALAKRLRGSRGWGLDDLREVSKVLEVPIAVLIGEAEYTPRDLNPEPTDLGGTVSPIRRVRMTSAHRREKVS